MAGDQAAFTKLESLANERGLPAHHYIDRWTEGLVMCKLKDRAGDKNLLARAGIERDVERVEGELTDPGGPDRIFTGDLSAEGTSVVGVAGGPATPLSVTRVDAVTAQAERLSPAPGRLPAPGYLPEPEAAWWAASRGDLADRHGMSAGSGGMSL